MARHTPPEPGRRPLTAILEKMPTCHRCSWVWRLSMFELKYLSAGCSTHRAVLNDLNAPPPLAAWLGTA
jgi:hypothetical protein